MKLAGRAENRSKGRNGAVTQGPQLKYEPRRSGRKSVHGHLSHVFSGSRRSRSLFNHFKIPQLTAIKAKTELSTTIMAVKKLALLIASQTGDLKGSENDVQSISRVLKRNNFEIHRCVRSAATREGILDSWDKLVKRCDSSRDVVVVYYSGHGGIVESSPADEGPSQQYQFLVPVDYNPTADDFRGVLDVEIAHLLVG